MSLSRRDFLKIAGVTAATLITGGIPFIFRRVIPGNKLRGSKRFQATCPNCSLGCSVNIHYNDDAFIGVTAVKNDPVSLGSLCPRAMALPQILAGKSAAGVLYKEKNSRDFKTIPESAAHKKIAERIKQTRDASYMSVDQAGITVNRTGGIAAFAGGGLTNEESYLFAKFARMIGLPYLLNSAIVAGDNLRVKLGEMLGIAGSTNSFDDIEFASVILIIGADPAMNSPVLYKKLMKSRRRGAKIVVVDPLLTKTALSADMHLRIRPGTDAALINCMTNYIMTNQFFDREYLFDYTNISFVVNDSFSYDDTRGLFSGYDPVRKKYTDRHTWSYVIDERGDPEKDVIQKKQNSVFNILGKQLSRYTPAEVSRICGVPENDIVALAELFAANVKMKNPGAVIAGGGLYNGFNGAQASHALVQLQLFSSNIGIPGGGIHILSGSGNAQGVYDMTGSFASLPGRLSIPFSDGMTDADIKSYIRNRSTESNDPQSVNLMKNFGKFFNSLLKAWYGDADSKTAFDLLPKGLTGYDELSALGEIGNSVKGVIAFGCDMKLPAHAPILKALSRSEWSVVSAADEAAVSKIKESLASAGGEVFIFGVDNSALKKGSVTSGERTVTWNDGYEGSTTARTELGIMLSLRTELVSLYRSGDGANPQQIIRQSWPYANDPPLEIFREIAGYKGDHAASSYADLDESETLCGNWLYAGMNQNDRNLAADRYYHKKQVLQNEWGYTWPLQMKILHPASSYDLKGRLRLDGERADIITDEAELAEELIGKKPFIVNKDGAAHIFSNTSDFGPLPVYFEPQYHHVSGRVNPYVSSEGIAGGIVAVNTSFSMNALSRSSALLAELRPGTVVELPEKLAVNMGIKSGEAVSVSNRYGSFTGTAVPTVRCPVIMVSGREVFIITVYGDNTGILFPGNDPKGLSGFAVSLRKG